MAWWNKKKQVEQRDAVADLLSALVTPDTITYVEAMTIPAFSASVHLISNTVASLPIKLHKHNANGETVEQIHDDPRTRLLNAETGDTLDSWQFKKAMVSDFLVYGGGYAYVNKTRNNIKSLHYVDSRQVSVVSQPDPIFKRNDILVFGQTFRDYEYIKLLRSSVNGGRGFGILAENQKMLSVAYNTLVFEETLVKTGGNKKGFLKSASKLSQDAINQLKQAWNNLYANNKENIVVLNNGLEFQEANNSSVEMQINQNKVTNNHEILNMFSIPVELFNGKPMGGNDEMYNTFVKLAILPILEAFEKAINAVLLKESEKGQMSFKFDTTHLMMADVLKRFQAYDYAVKNGILQIDEIRHIENYAPLGLNFIKLGLADVLYNPDTKQIYTPNTNALATMGDASPVDQDGQSDPAGEASPASANGASPKADTPDKKGVKKNESGNPK